MVTDPGLLKKVGECYGKSKNPKGYCELITFCDGKICPYQTQETLRVRREHEGDRYLTIHFLCKFNEFLFPPPATL